MKTLVEEKRFKKPLDIEDVSSCVCHVESERLDFLRRKRKYDGLSKGEENEFWALVYVFMPEAAKIELKKKRLAKRKVIVRLE